jgi:hypothetical protein
MSTSLDARSARSLAIPPPKNLSIPLGRRLDAKMAKNLMSRQPRRVPRDNGGGGFFPGMGEEMDETEVQVGWSGRGGMGDSINLNNGAGTGAAGAATAAPKPIIKKVPNTPRHLSTQTPTGVSTVAGLGALAPHQLLRGIHRKAVASPGKVIAKHAAIKVHALAPPRDGFMPGFGAFDMATLTSPKVLIGAGVAGAVWFFLLRKKRR